MMDKETEIKQTEKGIDTTAKPDSSAGLLIQAVLKISDPDSGEVLLKTKG